MLILLFIAHFNFICRGIMENLGLILSKKIMRWNLNNIYPGLYLQLGPTSDTNSILGFIVDTNQENDENMQTGILINHCMKNFKYA